MRSFLVFSYYTSAVSKIIGEALDEKSFKQFRARESTVVVATITDNGYPNTTLVHLISRKNAERFS